MIDLVQAGNGLPLFFFGLLYLAVFLYVILDGYDLGVGMLFAATRDVDERNLMIRAICPFWDANETWLVLGIGILLSAFPRAHGLILGLLYLPVAVMLTGLILRGAAFDFRVKAHVRYRWLWDGAFCAGSLLAGFAQGMMLGRYVTGFSTAGWAWPFAVAVGLALPAGYTLLGASWLIAKTSGTLQRRALSWARASLYATLPGLVAISLATATFVPGVRAKWLASPALALLPAVALALIVFAERTLRKLAGQTPGVCPPSPWLPLACAVGIFGLAFAGLCYTLFPYLVVDRLDLWQAAGSPASLRIMLLGVAVVLPCIVFYTAYAHWVFRGKVEAAGHDEPY